ncbi:MAG: hypothetical protein U1E65_33740 [Myxococcota bacterium]
MLLLATLLVGAIALDVSEPGGASPELVDEIRAKLSAALEARTSEPVISPSACPPGDCQTRVVVRVVTGLRRMSWTAELWRAQALVRAHEEKGSLGSSEAMARGVAEDLIPDLAPPPPAPQLFAAAPAEPAPIWPQLVLGTAALALTGVGVGFGVDSDQAYGRALTRPRYDAEFRALLDRHYQERNLAVALLVGAGACAIGAFVTSILD